MNNIKINFIGDIDMSIRHFIDNEMNAPHVNSIIFLYCLKNHNIINSVMDICIKTNSTQDQVKYALEFWSARGLCTIDFNPNNSFYTVTLLKNEQPLPKSQDLEYSQSAKIQQKSSYKPEEINYFMSNNENIKTLFSKSEKLLCKTLTHNEQNTLLDLHDRLNLPYEVILGIIDFCVLNDRRNIRYIEKVAINMSNNGINTIKKLNDYNNKTKDIYKEILDAIGAKNNIPSPSQLNIIDTWTNDLGFTKDIILEACDKASINASNPSLNYVNGILKTWKQENIKTLQDVIEYETKYQENKQKTKKSSNANNKVNLNKVKTKPSNFNNFEGHKRDLDDIAKKLNALR